MTRVVLDTNVLVSALLTENGTAAAILDLIIDGRLYWCVSEEVLAEYVEVFNRRKFKDIERSKIAALIALARSGEVTISTRHMAESPLEPDNRFYECAQAAQADYLITGNRKHFPKEVPPNKIVSPRDLVRLLARPGPPR